MNNLSKFPKRPLTATESNLLSILGSIACVIAIPFLMWIFGFLFGMVAKGAIFAIGI